MIEPLLVVEGVSKKMVACARCARPRSPSKAASITVVIGPNGAGKTTSVRADHRLSQPTGGRIAYKGADITGHPAHRLARQGMVRTFQIVQPFAGLTVLENIAVGAHLHIAGRAAALAAATEVAKPNGLEPLLQQSAVTLTVAGRKTV